MSYIIYTSSGTVLTTVPSGKINTATTGLTLIGRDVPNYGGYINQNLVYMLSNFASPTTKPPKNIITGQLWFDTTYNKLRVSGNSGFHVVGAAVVGRVQPVGQDPGEFWLDSTQNILNFVDSDGQYTDLLTIAALESSEVIIKKLEVTEELTVDGDVVIEGTLKVNGAQTTINSTVTTYVDPVIDLGTGPNLSSLVNVDEFDKGIIIHYNNEGGAENDTHAFMGYEHTQSRFMFKDNIYPGGVESFPVDNLRNTGTYAAIDAGEIRLFGNNAETTLHVGPTGFVIESVINSPPGLKTWVFNNNGSLTVPVSVISPLFVGTATDSQRLGGHTPDYFAVASDLTNAINTFNQSTATLGQSIIDLGTAFNSSLTNAVNTINQSLTSLGNSTASLAQSIIDLGTAFNSSLTNAVNTLNQSTATLGQSIIDQGTAFNSSLTNAVNTINQNSRAYGVSAETASGGANLRLTGTNSTNSITDDVTFAGGGATTVSRTDANTITISTPADTNTTYSQSAVSATGGANLRLTGSDSSTDDVKIAGGGAITVTATDANTITISTPADTNTTYGVSAETVSGGANLRLTGSDSSTDNVTIASGTGITVSRTDANTITITNTIADTDTNTTYSVSAETVSGGANLRLTGSDSSTDNVTIAAGSNVTVTRTDANTITISASTAPDSLYDAGSGSGALSFDRNNGTIQKYTLTNNVSSLAITNMASAQSFTIILTQDGTGNRTLTTSGSFKFASGYKTLSTAAGSIDMLNIFYDGSTYYCALTTGYA